MALYITKETEQFERRHNNELQELYGRPNILSYTRSKRLKWFGHVWRTDGRITKQALVAEMRGKKPLSKPRTRWKDIVVKDLRVIQERAQIDMAYYREEWNKIVMAALDLNGPLSCI